MKTTKTATKRGKWMWVWLDHCAGAACFAAKKPQRDDLNRIRSGRQRVDYACETQVELFTGLQLMPGEIRRVRFSVEVLQ